MDHSTRRIWTALMSLSRARMSEMMTTWSPLARSFLSTKDCSARRIVISGSALNSMPRERDGKIPGANRGTLRIHHDGAGDAHPFRSGTDATKDFPCPVVRRMAHIGGRPIAITDHPTPLPPPNCFPATTNLHHSKHIAHRYSCQVQKPEKIRSRDREGRPTYIRPFTNSANAGM